LGPGLDLPVTEIVSVAVGGFSTAVVTWSENVNNFLVADSNIQVQKGTSTWWDCTGALGGTGPTSIMGFLGGGTDPTRIRIVGTPTAVVPVLNPIGFPQEVPIPFP